jgi:hypothetical protein
MTNASKIVVADFGGEIVGDEYLKISLECLLPGSRLATVRAAIATEATARGVDRFPNVLTLCQFALGVAQTLERQGHCDAGAGVNQLQESVASFNRNGGSYVAARHPRPNAVYWPDPTYDGRSLYDELPFVRTKKIVRRETPIGSAGSCFAMEIANYLKAEGFNYIVTEENKISCAAWGIIFNAPSFQHLVEAAFGVRKRPRVVWTRRRKDGANEYLDPFREDVIFSTIEEYEAGYEKHLAAARAAFMAVKVFVITLGMNEVWFMANDGSALSRAPWNLAPHLTRRKVLTVDENVVALQRMLDTWRAFNPELQLIVTVSPVPLHATFRGDEHHVIAANQHSKATLRVAAEEFCNRNPDIATYFPSYETVLNCTPSPWEPDQRHVSPDAVRRVMALFNAMFVEG